MRGKYYQICQDNKLPRSSQSVNSIMKGKYYQTWQDNKLPRSSQSVSSHICKISFCFPILRYQRILYIYCSSFFFILYFIVFHCQHNKHLYLYSSYTHIYIILKCFTPSLPPRLTINDAHQLTIIPPPFPLTNRLTPSPQPTTLRPSPNLTTLPSPLLNPHSCSWNSCLMIVRYLKSNCNLALDRTINKMGLWRVINFNFPPLHYCSTPLPSILIPSSYANLYYTITTADIKPQNKFWIRTHDLLSFF